MEKFVIIILLEVVATISLVLFNGVLDSKYYERKPIGLDTWCYLSLFALAAIGMIYVMQRSSVFPWLYYWVLAQAFVQVLYHVIMCITLIKALNKFMRLELQYAVQYYLARFCLFFALTLEILAACGCIVFLMYWHIVNNLSA